MASLFDNLGTPLVQGPGAVSDYKVDAGERMANDFANDLENSPFAELGRMARRTYENNAPFFGGESNMVTPQVAKEELKARGLDSYGIDIPETGISRYDLDMKQYLKQQEIQRQSMSERPQSFFSHAAGLAGSFAAQAVDPINVASAFIPIVPELRAEAWIAKQGLNRGGRAAVRAGIGVTEGAVGGALVEPINYLSAQQENRQYGIEDSFANIVFGGIIGGGLHPIGGAVYDWRMGRAIKSMQDGLGFLNFRDMSQHAGDQAELDTLRAFADAFEHDEAPPHAADIINRGLTPEMRDRMRAADVEGEPITPPTNRETGQPLGKGLDELRPEADADRTKEAFNRQFLDKLQQDIVPGLGETEIRPPREDIFEVAQANFVGDTTHTAKMVPIDQLDGGVRMSDPKEAARVQEIADTMKTPAGYVERLIVDDRGRVIEGQHRLEALRQLGVSEVPVIEISEKTSGFPVDDMREAAARAGLMHSDQIKQIVDHAADAIREAGGVAEARKMFDAPRGYERVWNAVMDAAEEGDMRAQQDLAGDNYIVRFPVSMIEHGESAMPGGKMTELGAEDRIQDYAGRPTPLPPIELLPPDEEGGPWMVYDGSHRLEAAKLRGDDSIDAMVTPDELDQALSVEGAELVSGPDAFRAQRDLAEGGHGLRAQRALADQAEQTDTPEFKRFFRQSEVVDEDGNPLVVYHGTASDIQVPDKAKMPMWFSKEVDLAHRFIGGGRRSHGRIRQGSNILPAYLSIQKPLNLTGLHSGVHTEMTPRQFFKHAGIPESKMLEAAQFVEDFIAPSRRESVDGFHPWFGWSGHSSHSTTALDFLDRSMRTWELLDNRGIVALLKSKGYDGVMAKEFAEVNDNLMRGLRLNRKKTRMARSVTYAVFDPEQIKSAYGNSGAYDLSNADITAQQDIEGGHAPGSHYTPGERTEADDSIKPYQPNTADGTKAAGFQLVAGVRGSPGVFPASAAWSDEAPLSGGPRSVKIPGVGIVQTNPYPVGRRIAREWVESQGRRYEPITSYRKVDPARAARIAEAFDQMEHAPNDPRVKAAYAKMIEETMSQWEAIKRSGLQVEFIDISRGDPYANSPRLATEDVVNNNHLWVFSTDDGFGTEGVTSKDEGDNPLYKIVPGETISGRPVRANDIFRLVHDYFGHVKDGVGFRADGEENAWRSHARMYSQEALRAMTTETRGQNSWLNYGPHGETNRTAKTEDTIYAPQKIGLLPDWVMREGAEDLPTPREEGEPMTLAQEFGLDGMKTQQDLDDMRKPEDGPDAPKVIGVDAAGRPALDFRDSIVSHFTDEEAAADIRERGYQIVGDGYYGEAISFTPNREYGRQFGGLETSARIAPDARILNIGLEGDWKIAREVLDNPRYSPIKRPGFKSWREAFLERGIDGLYDAGAGDLFMYNNAKVWPVEHEQSRGGLLAQRDEEDGILVWHSSPHDFDKFTISAMGTGEGFQAYGPGLYFAESDKVSGRGGEYWKQFWNKMKTGPENSAANAMFATGFDSDKAIERLESEVKYYTEHSRPGRYGYGREVEEGNRQLAANYAAAAQHLRDGKIAGPRTYRVKLKVRPDELLDWDKKLSDQPEIYKKLSKLYNLQSKQAVINGQRLVTIADQHGIPMIVAIKLQSELRKGLSVDEAFANIRKLKASTQEAMDKWHQNVDELHKFVSDKTLEVQSVLPGEWTGQSIVKGINGLSPDEIAQTLMSAGIKGVRYLDGASRNADGWHITPPEHTVSGKWMVKSNDPNSKGLHFDTEEEAIVGLREKVNAQTRNYAIFDDEVPDIIDKFQRDEVADDGIDGWHGTPHLFERFSRDRIGTGEGTQNESKGFYFGSAAPTAEWYRNRLSAPPDYPHLSRAVFDKLDEEAPTGWERVAHVADVVFENIGLGEVMPDWKEFEHRVMSTYPNDSNLPEYRRALDILRDEGGWKDFFDQRRGHVYQVKIRLKPEEILDFDQAIKDQPKVLKALKQDEAISALIKPSQRGDALIVALERAYTPDGAVEWLQKNGIHGAKYPDQKSRIYGGDSFNYVVYNPDHIDIVDRFQRSLEEQPDLVAAHNLTSANLLHADKMGGIAAPSIAITRDTQGHDNFGEITLIAPKDLVDPQKGAKVFASDIYSARYPDITHDVKWSALKKLWSEFDEASKDLGHVLSSELSEDEIERKGNMAVRESAAAMLAYAREKKIKIEPTAFDEAAWRKKLDAAVEKERKAEEVMLADPENDEKIHEWRQARNEQNRVQWERDEPKNELRRRLKDTFRNDHDFWEWADQKFRSLNPKEKIFKGFNSQGMRRYMPHNLDNVVKMMTKVIRDGEGFNYGIGNLRAKVAPQFKSVAAIQKAKGRIIDKASFDKIKDEAFKEFNTIADQLLPKLKYQGNKFGQLDALSNHIAEAIDRNNVKRVLQEYYNDITDDDVRLVGNWLLKLKDMPTTYFEVKLPRAVNIGEFGGAVVPDNMSPKVRELLAKHGITNIREYPAGDVEARSAAINDFRDMKFQRDTETTNLGFYSAVERGLKEAGAKKALGKEWLGMLKNKPGVKAEELEFTGLGDFLTEHADETLTKEEVLKHANDHAVDVQEVSYGNDYQPGSGDYVEPLPEIAAEFADELAELRRQSQIARNEISRNYRPADQKVRRIAQSNSNDWYTVDYNGDWSVKKYASEAEAQSAMDEANAISLDLLDAEKRLQKITDREVAIHQEITERTIHKKRTKNFYRDVGRAKYESYTLPGGTDYRELVLKIPTFNKIPDFSSSHFDEDNILAHTRISDRILPDGTKALHVEEVQSDWHQEGRRLGYDNKSSRERFEAAVKRAEEIQAQIKPRLNAIIKEMGYESYQDIIKVKGAMGEYERRTNSDAVVQDLYKRYDKANLEANAVNPKNYVPDAPFKKSWHELMMKRLIRYAAENGYSKILLTPGQLQADRFDLSREVSEIRYEKNEDQNLYEIRVFNKNKEEFFREQNLAADELKEHVGAEMAAKIVNDEGKPHSNQSVAKWRSLSGLDLKVGGEGMKGFYDSIIPNFLNKYGKKYGAKVGSEDINIRPTEVALEHQFAVRPTRYGWDVTRHDGMAWSFDSEAEANAFVDREVNKTATVHSFPITEQMRKDVMQGQPLFQKDLGAPTPGGGGTKLDFTPLSAEQKVRLEKLMDEVDGLIRKMVGQGVNTKWYDRIRGRERGTTYVISGGYVKLRKLIILTMESENLTRTAKHEAIHALKDLGFFSDAEWDTLVRAAIDGKWLDKKYGSKNTIRERYKNKPLIEQIEEAIAEEFSFGRASLYEGYHPLVRKAMLKIKDFADGLGAAMRKVFGQYSTPEDIFRMVERGEMAERQEPAAATQGPRQGFTPNSTINRFQQDVDRGKEDAIAPQAKPGRLTDNWEAEDQQISMQADLDEKAGDETIQDIEADIALLDTHIQSMRGRGILTEKDEAALQEGNAEAKVKEEQAAAYLAVGICEGEA